MSLETEGGVGRWQLLLVFSTGTSQLVRNSFLFEIVDDTQQLHAGLWGLHEVVARRLARVGEVEKDSISAGHVFNEVPHLYEIRKHRRDGEERRLLP